MSESGIVGKYKADHLNFARLQKDLRNTADLRAKVSGLNELATLKPETSDWIGQHN